MNRHSENDTWVAKLRFQKSDRPAIHSLMFNSFILNMLSEISRVIICFLKLRLQKYVLYSTGLLTIPGCWCNQCFSKYFKSRKSFRKQISHFVCEQNLHFFAEQSNQGHWRGPCVFNQYGHEFQSQRWQVLIITVSVRWGSTAQIF